MIGQELAQYKIIEKIGSGGMGTVYRARDTSLDRDAAIKVLPEELTKDAGRKARFEQEAKSASAVNHPAIASIYEISEDGDTTYIAMEFVDGSTVRQLVERNELDIGAAMDIGIQVGDALAAAHRAGIVHRDIKSDNIMLTRDGHPKVLDFGLAKLSVADDESDTVMADQRTLAMTQAGMVMGTIAYLSPEQARGQVADPRSDIFSFGIVLYEMATGKLPFQGDNALDTMHAIAFEQSQPIAKLREGLPHSLQRIIDRCLEKEPQNRYQSFDEAITDLRKVRRQLDSGASMSMPFLHRLRPIRGGVQFGKLSTRGVVVATIWALLLSTLILTVLTNEGGIWGVLPFVVIGLIVFSRFRNQRRRLVNRFVNKSKKMKEVQLINFEAEKFLVVLEDAPARCYLKLNAILEGVNDRLYSGDDMTLEIRENLSMDEIRALSMESRIRYLRKDL